MLKIFSSNKDGAVLRIEAVMGTQMVLTLFWESFRCSKCFPCSEVSFSGRRRLQQGVGTKGFESAVSL